MVRRWMRMATVIVVSTALLDCSDATAPAPSHSDVDLARSVWLATHPASYTFDVATTSSWSPTAGYYRVEVRAGEVVSARDPLGRVDPNFTLTVETIWDRLITARAEGQLNSATFDGRGVPLETDMGSWPVDGGVHYSVRDFAATR